MFNNDDDLINCVTLICCRILAVDGKQRWQESWLWIY